MTDLNLLLLGDRGSGKTTFINAIVNYFKYEDNQDAESNGVVVTARMQISVIDANCTSHSFRIEPTFDETPEMKASKIKEYVFRCQGHKLRLIDSSGVTDFEKFLKQLTPLKQLHAVCFFVKSSLSRANILFEQSIRQTFAQLGVSVIENFIFIFTDSRRARFSSGVAKDVLKGTINSIKSKPPYIDIPLNDQNMFCVDNEAFINLVAVPYGVKFDYNTLKASSESWDKSAAECQRLISYVEHLKPYQFKTENLSVKMEEFIKMNVYNFCEIFGSSKRNLQKCEQMRNDSKMACDIIENLQQLRIQLASAESEQKKNQSLPQRSNKMAKLNKRKNAQNNGSSSNSNFQNTNTARSQQNFSSCDGSLTVKKESSINTNLEKNMEEEMSQLKATVTSQHKFIERTFEVAEFQKKEFYDMLETMTKYIVFFLNNEDTDDSFKKEMHVLMPLLEDSEDRSTFDRLYRRYEKIKSQLQKPVEEVTSENIDKLVKKFEKLNHYKEILNKILED